MCSTVSCCSKNFFNLVWLTLQPHGLIVPLHVIIDFSSRTSCVELQPDLITGSHLSSGCRSLLFIHPEQQSSSHCSFVLSVARVGCDQVWLIVRCWVWSGAVSWHMLGVVRCSVDLNLCKHPKSVQECV